MMDALKPGHAHRSSSDRLLNNYLDSQKNLSTSLLTLLSHSHSSTSSLLAYVTSSPGVVAPVRRSVRHAAFEGPLSAALVNNPLGHPEGDDEGDVETQGWAAYIASLDEFRKDLKQIHALEEEMSRVRRDREILVTRLIKNTKSRPTKSDLSAIASTYRSDIQSSRASTMSLTSNGSTTSRESKRAGKLADAQAELLGCEEHLRSLEVRIEQERNSCMTRGLEDRFRAMEAVGRMWVGQAQRGLEDLEKVHEMSSEAFELDSNASLAPSQSASQTNYEDSPRRGAPFSKRPLGGAGSITGSIAEENEDSSDDGNQGNLVMHENRPQSRASTFQAPAPVSTTGNKPSPLGLASVNARAQPSITESAAFNYRSSGGRRAASDVGVRPYQPPAQRQALRRTYSADKNTTNRRAASDNSSIRSAGRGAGGGGQKKKGFFASISRFFKGPKRERSGRDSPPYGSSGKSWHTRTDANLKRSSSMYGSGRRGGDESSSDDEGGNFVSVSNNRQSGGFSVDNMGKVPANDRAPSRASTLKRTSSGPVASGLIPPPAGMKREGSQSTITVRSQSRAGAATPTRSKTPTDTLSRTNTLKSSASAKSVSTARSSGTTTKKRIRPNGSISRSTSLGDQQAAQGRTIMSLVDMKTPPTMPEVPKAPKSQVNPQMELAKAPGSSLVARPASSAPTQNISPAQSPAPTPGNLSRTTSKSSVKKISKEPKHSPPRTTTPLPPSRLLSPPLKSALRPSSPSPNSEQSQAPPLEAPSKPLFSISAPGPVNLPEDKPEPMNMPAAPNKSVATAPPNTKRNSFQSMTTSDGNSVYESAAEDPDRDESSDSDQDMSGFECHDNPRIQRIGEINVGPPEVERVSGDEQHVEEAPHSDHEGSVTSTDTATRPGGMPAASGQVPGRARALSNVSGRKSVRMAVPDSPTNAANANGGDGEARVASPDVQPPHEQWNTRIGRMRDDTSDESDHDDNYLAARKGLIRNSGKWETTSDGGKKKIKRKSGPASVSSKTSGTSKGSRRQSGIV